MTLDEGRPHDSGADCREHAHLPTVYSTFSPMSGSAVSLVIASIVGLLCLLVKLQVMAAAELEGEDRA